MDLWPGRYIFNGRVPGFEYSQPILFEKIKVKVG